MSSIKQMAPTLQKLGLLILNARAARQASELHLLSREFLLGFLYWSLSAGSIFLQARGYIHMPEPFVVLIKGFSLFAGWFWIVLPMLVYLERKMDYWVHGVINVGRSFRFLTGITLWQQAAQGKLSSQLLGAFLVGILLGFALLAWPVGKPWQILLALTFFINILFYIIFPLLIFSGKWIDQRMQKKLLQRKRGLAH